MSFQLSQVNMMLRTGPAESSEDRCMEKNISHVIEMGAGGQVQLSLLPFFPTCQVRVVSFYVSLLRFLLLLLLLLFFLVLLRLLRRRAVQCPVSAGNRHVQCRPATAIIGSAVFPAGPQPRLSALSVPCRTSTATICAQCSLPDLNRDVRQNVRRYVRKNIRENVRQNVRKNVTRYVRNNIRRNVRKNVRKTVRRNVRKNVRQHI